MAQKITYADKVQGQANPNPTNQQWRFGDANEVKTALNSNADLLDFQNHITGVITGGIVTINGGDNTKFDVSAGEGSVFDWTDPENPVRTMVSFGPFVAQSVPNLASVFTVLNIDVNGDLIMIEGRLNTPQEKRLNILLQSVVHLDGLVIDAVTCGSTPAYDVVPTILDYIAQLGPVNSGNLYSANGANLKANKDSGVTSQPFINRCNDINNPNNKSNPAQTPVPVFTTSYRDGSGGYTFDPQSPVDEINPDLYDDGSGELAEVGNNKWTIRRIIFFGTTNASTITYGQTIYGNITDARNAILTEELDLAPVLTTGAFVTALIVKKGATDLSDIAVAEFVRIVRFELG